MLNHIRAAITFLTILPLGGPPPSKFADSLPYFPLVGLGLGACLMALAQILPINSEIGAFLILLAWAVTTGGLHLDGWADSCDGLLAATRPERRLEIMHDPRNGTWATVGLIFLLLGKYLALRQIPPHALLFPPLWGRWAMLWAIYAYPPARPEGLGASFREGFGRQAWWAASAFSLTTTLILILLIGVGWPLLALLIFLMALIWLFLGWAAGRLGGGLTGDVYGAACELTEILSLWGLGVLL